MPYQPHVKLIANGGMPGGERWSCTLAFAAPPDGSYGMSQADMDLFAAQGLARWSTFLAASGTRASDYVTLQRVDVRQINSAGQTIRLSQVTPSAAVAGTGTLQLPNQVATVVSLRTGVPGARGRGRIYLPLLAMSPEPTGRIPASYRTALAATVATMLNGLNSDIAPYGSPSGARLAVASGVGTIGDNPVVVQARVGDVLDTQRRRRDALVEAYVQVNLT